ncbi:helix-turn-helix domain-containing protein [Virgibacillus alimentarius]|uniref:Transcriptional regulator with XRE-family HTH domain n=1 Tax=Virgibacillus alimentarius TaxID=698769 RepID=A0ABS4S6X1_9BACI|nr:MULTISPECIES: helix-turn-helix transcriptional regulator [Virgibacillus]MBP2257154.1 transcriptional regulator with XRE-family HTH domain [Virgibacillus alimentarius]HLR66637.1 helix-turn-helix transcriptional regulator [Virgibacillus sp.]
MDTKRVGRRIKAFRKLKGYTQIDLAKKINVPIAHLGAVERGTMIPSGELLDKVSESLNISKEELMLEDIKTKE